MLLGFGRDANYAGEKKKKKKKILFLRLFSPGPIDLSDAFSALTMEKEKEKKKKKKRKAIFGIEFC